MNLRGYIDAAIDRGEGEGCFLCISGELWPEFKQQVPRREYRKRQGTRFINAYRGVPISIHPEWSWGWQLVPVPARRLAA